MEGVQAHKEGVGVVEGRLTIFKDRYQFILCMCQNINPKVDRGGMARFGKSGFNIKLAYGIDSKDFLKIHETLAEKGLRTPYEQLAGVYIHFELFCNELLKMNFDISNLLSEFNKAQKNNREDTAHAMSLTKLCYHYTKSGFNVKINKTKKKTSSHDLIINGVTCDLKVRHDQVNHDMQQYFHLLEKNEELFYDVLRDKIRSRYEDLKSALESRAEKGFQQADCLIFDLSDHFHSWNYHRIESYIKEHQTKEFSQEPLRPIPNSCIIFSPDNVVGGKRPAFKPRAYWGYVLWDSEKREFGRL